MAGIRKYFYMKITNSKFCRLENLPIYGKQRHCECSAGLYYPRLMMSLCYNWGLLRKYWQGLSLAFGNLAPNQTFKNFGGIKFGSELMCVWILL